MARPTPQRATRFVFLPARHVPNLPAGSVVHEVSSYADFPYCQFSPLWAHGGIPVPGQPGVTSDSVEGVWQGLKVIRGQMAPRYFRGRGAKRGGKPSGHQFGDQLLGLLEARRKIYLPAYEWMLEHRIDPTLIEGFLEQARAGQTLHFHDLGDNGDPGNLNEGWAHAAILVGYLRRRAAAG